MGSSSGDLLSLYFTAPRKVELRPELLPETAPGQVLVKSCISAISPGTEMLVYRGQFPRSGTRSGTRGGMAGTEVDETLSSLPGGFAYPLKYGYSAVGEVLELGAGVGGEWLGKRVFALQPHASHFISRTADLHPLPDGFEPEEAVFLPNMETAVNFAQDGAPLTGERVAVVGQGIVGLLTTALLSRFPLEQLVTFDRYLLRRQASLSLGASASLDPAEAVPWSRGEVDLLEAATTYGEFDLVYELSGDPSALDLAISLCGFGGRVVIGSWYGEKMAPVDLGGKFHRSRIQLIGSQVSTIAPSLSGRWDKPRRLGVAWEMLRKVKPASLITQTFPFEQAAEAYRLIDEHPEETVQVVLTY